MLCHLRRKLILTLVCSATLAPASFAADLSGREEARALRELHIALDRWIAATNARDFNAQAKFYPSRMEAFYLKRQVPKAAVMTEKRRVFQSASHIDIDAEDPQIILESNGERARMYFRKAYDIRTGGRQREGEVLQELRWVKSHDGWKIVSERDLYVIE